MKEISNVVYGKNKKSIPNLDDSVDLFIDLQEKAILLFTSDFGYCENKIEPQSGSMICVFFKDEKQCLNFYNALRKKTDKLDLDCLDIQDVINIIFNINRYNRFKTINIAISNN